MSRTFKSLWVAASCLCLLAAGVLVERVAASDEYLATASPLNQLTASATTAYVIDLAQYGPRQRIVLAGNITITAINGARAGLPYDVWFQQDATGSRTVAWPSNIRWQGGSAPTITTTATYQDRITLFWDPLNAQWMAVASQNYH